MLKTVTLLEKIISNNWNTVPCQSKEGRSSGNLGTMGTCLSPWRAESTPRRLRCSCSQRNHSQGCDPSGLPGATVGLLSKSECWARYAKSINRDEKVPYIPRTEPSRECLPRMSLMESSYSWSIRTLVPGPQMTSLSSNSFNRGETPSHEIHMKASHEPGTLAEAMFKPDCGIPPQ